MNMREKEKKCKIFLLQWLRCWFLLAFVRLGASMPNDSSNLYQCCCCCRTYQHNMLIGSHHPGMAKVVDDNDE